MYHLLGNSELLESSTVETKPGSQDRVASAALPFLFRRLQGGVCSEHELKMRRAARACKSRKERKASKEGK
jgi:hypothetical protein